MSEYLFEDEPCSCRRLSPGLYGVAKGCPRHDAEGLGCTHFSCVHWYTTLDANKKPIPVVGIVCLACDENARRGDVERQVAA